MKNVELLLNDLKMKFTQMGFGSQDPVINNVLGILSNESFNARTPEAIEVLTGKIEQLVNMDPEVLMNRLKVKIGKMKAEQDAMNQYYEEKQEDLEIDSERRLDEVQENSLENAQMQNAQEEMEEEQDKDDLFILVQNNDNFRLQDREAIMKDKTDRQRNVFERNLKLLEALDAIREVSRKTDGMLQVDLNNMMDLPPNEFELQKKLLSRFKLQPLSAKGFELDRENPERQINLETITKEDLEKGDIVFAIPFENLQKMGDVYKKFREQMQEHLKLKEIEVDNKEPLSIEDDVINALAGVDRNAKDKGKNKEDEELVL